MDQLAKHPAAPTSQQSIQNQKQPQLHDENAHNHKSVHQSLIPTFCFNEPAPTEIYTLSLHDALPISGEEGGRNAVVFGFDLRDSDLAVQPAFPLLMRNLVTYLLPLPAGGLPDAVVPGQTVSLEPEIGRAHV